MISDDIDVTIEGLLNVANIAGSITSVDVLVGGKNNQTYVVCCDQRERYVVKKYFQHSLDLRDRQNTELLFSSYANKVAADFVPKIYAFDKSAGVTLFEFIDGCPISQGHVQGMEVETAINFINALNAIQSRSSAQLLPIASEACFAVQDHLDLVDRRIDALFQILHDDIGRDRSSFIRNLANFWSQLKASIIEEAINCGLEASFILPVEDRCISPSDFGFHNAIKGPGEEIRFIDFEYAGWDDPAKLVGDFFSQLAVPVPEQYFTDFVESIAHNFSDSELFKVRARLLMPVYQIKWCCIALNVFLPTHLSRRKFSNPLIDISKLQNDQLSKAKSLLSTLEKKFHELH